MKPEIHPKYYDVEARCACGATWKTRSTKQELHLEICSNCHPFFTGRQKLIDTEGRVERFTKKFGAQTVEQRKAAATPRRQSRRRPPRRSPFSSDPASCQSRPDHKVRAVSPVSDPVAPAGDGLPPSRGVPIAFGQRQRARSDAPPTGLARGARSGSPAPRAPRDAASRDASPFEPRSLPRTRPRRESTRRRGEAQLPHGIGAHTRRSLRRRAPRASDRSRRAYTPPHRPSARPSRGPAPGREALTRVVHARRCARSTVSARAVIIASDNRSSRLCSSTGSSGSASPLRTKSK